MMSKLTRVLMIAAATIASMTAHTARARAAEAETVKIGALFPFSGPNASFGANSRNGMQMALDRINDNGGIKSLGGAKVELVYADVPAPTNAAAATQRLIGQEKVVGIVGAFVSSITLAASEVTERAGVPMITHSFADQITGRGYKYIFQVSPKASVFGQTQFGDAVAVAKEAGTTISKVAILYEDTAYGTAQAKGLRDAAQKAGISVVVDEGYPLGITDVSPLITKLRNSEAQIVFPVSYAGDSISIIRAMRQQHLTTPVIGGAAGYIIPDFQKGLGELADGVFSIAPADYDAAPDLAADYKKRFGAFMPHEAIMYGAALEDMVRAIEKSGSRDPEKIRDAIADLKYCEGFAAAIPGGCVAFDANGLTSTAFPILVEWRGAELVTVYPPQSAKTKPIWAGQTVN